MHFFFDRKVSFLVLAVFCQAVCAQGPRQRFQREAYTTETPMAHDPVMAKEGDTYYLYATGMGIQQMTSKDRKNWTVLPQPVMSVMPGWTTDSVPGFGSHVWAPDVIQWHGRWWMAYSCSTFGKNGSAIGLLSTRSLRSGIWTDEGCIVTSHNWKKDASGKRTGDNWNAIDPNFVIDTATDTPWMVWGSFWDGIQIAKLDSTMHIAKGEKPRTIARRYEPGFKPKEGNPTSKFAGTNAIEAPFVYKHGEYYYLFVSWDYCCRGAKSNYRVAVGRSKTVDGPYLDRNGKDMLNGGGTLFLEGDKKEWEAAGHCAAYTFDGQDIFVCHGYSTKMNGAAFLMQRAIRWTDDAWPELGGESVAAAGDGTRAAEDNSIKVTENIAYRTDVGPNTVLDMAEPLSGPRQNRPAILIIHGGGWSAGSKNDMVYRTLMIDYAMKGYVVCNMNYRLVQEAPMPACIEDVKSAIQWMKSNARRLGIDPRRIGTYGHSAGGHLSLMAGLTADVACAAGGAPPTEIGRAGEWADHKEWWPIGYIGRSKTPFLVLQGGEDPVVRPGLTEDWVVKMQKAGSSVDYVKVHGQHGVAFDQQLEFTRPAMDAFFARHLKHDDPTVSFEQMKVPDYGGSGRFKAVALREKTLPDFVVYRPMNLGQAVAQNGKLPVLVFCNGGCMDTSIGYENMLTDIASHGYMVVGVGQLQMLAQHEKDQHTPSAVVKKALDWISQQAADTSSPYYNKVDTEKIAAAGHSCGGAQVLANAADPRLKTCVILNAGMGTMTMADASAKSLKNLHGPVLYLVGGTDDVAWKNAQMDYDAIRKVPVALADNTKSGHGGTYEQPNGGANSRMVRAWLDWQLKGAEKNAGIFLDNDLADYPEWTMKAKNFKTRTFFEDKEVWIEHGNRKIFGVLHQAKNIKKKMPLAIIAHGFNGTHDFGKNYFEPLAKLGFRAYSFDFPCGSVRSRSDNNTMEMSVFDEKKDLEAIVEYFRKQPYVDASRIVLIGESQGGLVSALAAADLKKKVSELVLVYPALCIPDNWNERYPEGSVIPDTTMMWNVPLGRRYFEEVRPLKVFSEIGQYQQPVLIVQGDKDPVVSMKDSERAVKLYKNARLHVIPGAGHGFKPYEFRQAAEQIDIFLKTNNHK